MPTPKTGLDGSMYSLIDLVFSNGGIKFVGERTGAQYVVDQGMVDDNQQVFAIVADAQQVKPDHHFQLKREWWDETNQVWKFEGGAGVDGSPASPYLGCGVGDVVGRTYRVLIEVSELTDVSLYRGTKVITE